MRYNSVTIKRKEIQMRKLLIPLMALSGVSFASTLDMSTLSCGNMPINSATTLDMVVNTCTVKDQYAVTYGRFLGMYEVKFVNSATNDTVKCDFSAKDGSALVNGCR
jgi:hypothetical protein